MYISFQDLHDPTGVIEKKIPLIFILYRTYKSGVVDIDITI